MTSFYRAVHLEIEEVGWEQLVRANEDLTVLSFKILDKRGRFHILETVLNKNYPKFPPAISADVPHLFSLKWSPNSRLKDVVKQFSKHIEELQDFWSVMENIDKFLSVVGPEQPSRAVSFRNVSIGNDCVVVLNVNADDPRSLPEVECELFKQIMEKKCQTMHRLMKDQGWKVLMHLFELPSFARIQNFVEKDAGRSEHKSFVDNLSTVLEAQIQGPLEVNMNHHQLECGICYAQYLPTDIELGSKSGSGTDYTCDNTNCSKAFHSVCLADWLRSITTTRQSFDVLFGACPYCSDPVAVKISHAS